MENENKNLTGLTSEQVIQNRKKFGANILTPPEKDSLLKRFLEKLTGPFGHLIPKWEDGDPLIFILEIAAVLSVFISCAEYNGWLGLSTNAGAGVGRNSCPHSTDQVTQTRALQLPRGVAWGGRW